MRYCKKCTMPDTRPGITFDAEGVCSACRHFENRKNVDWDARFKEFEAYCNKYRGMNGPGGYDCAVAVSGGKDSHFQTYVVTQVYGLKPLLVTYHGNNYLPVGLRNLRNLHLCLLLPQAKDDSLLETVLMYDARRDLLGLRRPVHRR